MNISPRPRFLAFGTLSMTVFLVLLGVMVLPLGNDFETILAIFLFSFSFILLVISVVDLLKKPYVLVKYNSDNDVLMIYEKVPCVESIDYFGLNKDSYIVIPFQQVVSATIVKGKKLLLNLFGALGALIVRQEASKNRLFIKFNVDEEEVVKAVFVFGSGNKTLTTLNNLIESRKAVTEE